MNHRQKIRAYELIDSARKKARLDLEELTKARLLMPPDTKDLSSDVFLSVVDEIPNNLVTIELIRLQSEVHDSFVPACSSCAGRSVIDCCENASCSDCNGEGVFDCPDCP